MDQNHHWRIWHPKTHKNEDITLLETSRYMRMGGIKRNFAISQVYNNNVEELLNQTSAKS